MNTSPRPTASRKREAIKLMLNGRVDAYLALLVRKTGKNDQ